MPHYFPIFELPVLLISALSPSRVKSPRIMLPMFKPPPFTCFVILANFLIVLSIEGVNHSIYLSEADARIKWYDTQVISHCAWYRVSAQEILNTILADGTNSCVPCSRQRWCPAPCLLGLSDWVQAAAVDADKPTLCFLLWLRASLSLRKPFLLQVGVVGSRRYEVNFLVCSF